MNPCAKFVSKELKPLILAAPTVIHGSKDLAIKLSKLKILPRHRWYFVSGDVVAFYPNIPLDSCLQIVSYEWLKYKMWPEPFFDTDTPEGYELKSYADLFRRAIRVGNSKLISQYNGKKWLQLRGLAMGVADSPDLANLYGCHFEEKAEVLKDKRFAFYGRYIDVILSIIYASSEEKALKIAQEKISYDGCEITWQVSSQHMQFLDMFLFRGIGDTIQWRPYRKANNHLERVPWTSFHPLDVKRGTFLGEMSRLAVLCSEISSYTEALKDLVILYVRRGYPNNLVKSWINNYAKDKWIKRFNDNSAHENAAPMQILVLKTEFNPVWNYFNAKEVGDSMITYWRYYMEHMDRRDFVTRDFSRPIPMPESWRDVEEYAVLPEFSKEVRGPQGEFLEILDTNKLFGDKAKLITSRKRTTNLFNLTSLWKKAIFTELEHRIPVEANTVRPVRNLPQADVNSQGTPAEARPTAGQSGVAQQADPVLDYRLTRGNLHQRSPSPNKPFFG